MAAEALRLGTIMTMSRSKPSPCSLVRALALATLTFSGVAYADTVPIELVARGQNRITMDGILGDWRRFTELVAVDETAQVVTGQGAWSGPADASFGFAFVRDEHVLYFAAEVRDDQIVRSREHRANDDALIVTLSVNASNNRALTYEFAVYPGEPGNYGGAVRFRAGRAGAVPGAQVVESPLRGGGGYTIEVSIPWSSLPGLSNALGSLRGRVAYQDSDRHATPAIETLLASGPGDAQHPAQLAPAAGTSGASAADMLAEFQRTHDLVGAEPFMDRSANFAGDAQLERLVVLPHYVLAMGPGIAGGTRYAFFEFPMRSRDDVLEVTARDLTGDGRQELILRLRVENNGMTRELLYVYGAPSGDHLERLFAQELRRTQGNNDVQNRATYENGGRIRVTFQSAAGFTQANYPRVVENGVNPPLLPWSANRVVVYRWSDDNQRFDEERAEPNPNAARSGESAPAPASAPTSPTMVQAPDLTALLRLFRTQRNIPENVRPSFSVQANVAGDATPETVQIVSRYLLVMGPRFMNGRSFYNVELPVANDADVLSLSFADVTDDGRMEALVRVRRVGQAQVRGQTLDVTREYVLAYSIDDVHRGRVFGAEVSRRVGNDAITNVVQIPQRGRNAELVIDAGQARGWSQQSYPFRDAPQQGFAPILLPWDARRRVTYRWNGTALVPVP